MISPQKACEAIQYNPYTKLERAGCHRWNCTYSRRLTLRGCRVVGVYSVRYQEQPEVDPQLTHLVQVPERTMVNWPHSPQGSPSYPLERAIFEFMSASLSHSSEE